MMFISILVRSLLLAAIPSSLILTGYGTNYEEIVKAREEYANNSQGDVVVVAIRESWADSYIKGIQLAIRQINEREGKLLGRTLRLRIEDAKENYEKDRSTIMKIAADPEVSAVLGHHRTEDAIPASVVYEESQVVFMPPLTTGKDTTTHNFNYVFRMIPHNGVMARQLASVAKLLGYKKIALLYSFGYSRRELAFLFEDAAVELNMHFVARRSFNAEQLDYRDLIAQFNKDPVDMVFISSDTTSGARMIKQLREMGIEAPIMGGNSLNLGPLKELTGADGDGTIVPAIYRPRSDNIQHSKFIEAYKTAYQKAPDQNAAQGFDSINLLAYAINKGKSTHPKSIASALHHMPYWTGITGVHSFNTRGDVVGKKYFFQVLKNNQWNWLPAVHFPYILWQFDRINASIRGNSITAPKEGFVRAFVYTTTEDDLRMLQISFLKEIFNFNRFGVIYAEDGDPKKTTRLSRMKNFAMKANFKLETCGVSQIGVTPEDMEKQLIRCLGSLAVKSDMINITGINTLNHEVLERIQAPLEEYKIPLISITGDTDLGDLATMRIGKFGNMYNTHTESFINLFGDIVSNQHVHDFSEKIENLPVINVNLQKLDQFNLLKSTPLVQLSPDFLIEPAVRTPILTPPQTVLKK